MGCGRLGNAAADTWYREETGGKLAERNRSQERVEGYQRMRMSTHVTEAQKLTRPEEEPKEPHRHGREIIVRRPRIIAYRNPRARRAVLRKPKRAQPAVQPRVLPQLPLVLPVILQHHQICRPEHLMQRPHTHFDHSLSLTCQRRTSDGAPDARAQPSELHKPPTELSGELGCRRRRCASGGAETAHEGGGVEFGGKDARVEVRVRQGGVGASVEEEERRELARRAERVAGHGEERDVLDDFEWDRIERGGHVLFFEFRSLLTHTRRPTHDNTRGGEIPTEHLSYQAHFQLRLSTHSGNVWITRPSLLYIK